MAGRFSYYREDPYVAPGFTRAALRDEVDAVVIGGGSWPGRSASEAPAPRKVRAWACLRNGWAETPGYGSGMTASNGESSATEVRTKTPGPPPGQRHLAQATARWLAGHSKREADAEALTPMQLATLESPVTRSLGFAA